MDPDIGRAAHRLRTPATCTRGRHAQATRRIRPREWAPALERQARDADPWVSPFVDCGTSGIRPFAADDSGPARRWELPPSSPRREVQARWQMPTPGRTRRGMVSLAASTEDAMRE